MITNEVYVVVVCDTCDARALAPAGVEMQRDRGTWGGDWRDVEDSAHACVVMAYPPDDWCHLLKDGTQKLICVECKAKL